MSPIPNVLVDGAKLAIQPSRFIPQPPRPRMQRGINGAHVSSTPEFGWVFEFVYGSAQLAAPGSLAVIIDAFGDGLVHELTYTDEEQVTHDHNVYMPRAASQAIRWANNAERLSFEVYETDQEAVGGS